MTTHAFPSRPTRSRLWSAPALATALVVWTAGCGADSAPTRAGRPATGPAYACGEDDFAREGCLPKQAVAHRWLDALDTYSAHRDLARVASIEAMPEARVAGYGLAACVLASRGEKLTAFAKYASEYDPGLSNMAINVLWRGAYRHLCPDAFAAPPGLGLGHQRVV